MVMQSMQASEPLLRRVCCRREDLFDGQCDFNHIVDKNVIVVRLQSYGCVHKQQVIAIKHTIDKHVCVHVHVCASANACQAITDRLCSANRYDQ